ncbi:MAG TPA: hypothetical protein DCR95_12555 [Desulfobacter sp.]|nr:hypothetical protein [Desulfobacter sp.]
MNDNTCSGHVLSFIGNFAVLDKNPRFSRIQIRSLLFKFLSSLEKKPLLALFGGMGKKPQHVKCCG